jgi:uncharacterized membrane protein YwaF
MNDSAWILRPFNAVFCGVFAAFILLLIAASLIVRRKSDGTKKAVIVTACALTLIGFFVYKYFLSIDAEFDRLTASMGGFNWWGDLPLQLCNINMLLIPVAVLTGKRPLLSFCFFVGPLGALMAVVMPGMGFDGYSLLLPRMLGYFGTHFMIFIEGLAIVTFGLYRPQWRDIPLTMLALFVIALLVFGINMLLRATHLHPQANYFFSVETEGNPLLELFYSWLPWPFLFLLPSLVVVAVYAGVITACFAAAGRLRAKTRSKATVSE